MYRYPHSSSAFWYGGAAWTKDALSDERDDSLLLMRVGMFFMVVGGWLLSRWTYCSVVLGSMKGWWVFLFRLKVMFEKLMVCLLASIRSPL